GLKYRANKIIKLKNQLINEFDRKIPSNFEDLKKLPGIGDYNANAILCFGFKKKRALLDNNFIRVYQRVFNVKSYTKTPKTDKFLWNFSESLLLPITSYLTFNYGVLDFGGIICLPKIPKCQICFLKEICFYEKNS
ncbi:MAG: A/G-specific adenine glycosylase, partial [Candidatus Hodarchaeota archaeon]